MQFSAVAEVHSSAVDLVDDTLVVRANGHSPWARYGKGQPIWGFCATYFFKHLGVSKA